MRCHSDTSNLQASLNTKEKSDVLHMNDSLINITAICFYKQTIVAYLWIFNIKCFADSSIGGKLRQIYNIMFMFLDHSKSHCVLNHLGLTVFVLPYE